MEENRALPLVLTAQRERTISELIAQFAADALDLPEFERRLDLANRALTVPDLALLTSDLPALPQAPPPVAAPAQRGVVDSWTRAHQLMVAIMGGVTRRGRWNPAQRTFLFCFWGGAELDFREAVLPEGITEVTVVAIMGGAEILVPPGVNVETNGLAIMGGFDHAAHGETGAGPTLRINGLALMGGVEVKSRLPGESGKEARNRVREEQRRLREENRRT